MSVISYWEVVIKANRGQLAVGDPSAWWKRALSQLGGEALPLRSPHITALIGLPDHHRDPFDRILIAQALAEDLTLLTSDAMLRAYPARVRW